MLEVSSALGSSEELFGNQPTVSDTIRFKMSFEIKYIWNK